jgi:hypothetical protein
MPDPTANRPNVRRDIPLISLFYPNHQVIVATEVNTGAADVGNLIPMTEKTVANTGQALGQMLADAGYYSADNLAAEIPTLTAQ